MLCFKNLTIKHLKLTRNNATDKGFKYLGTLKNLRTLDIKYMRNLNDNCLKQIKDLKLTSLSLSGIHFSSASNITNIGLSYIGNIHTLQELDIRDCDKITFQGFKHLTSLLKLQTLDVRNSSFCNHDLGFIQNLPLKKLNLSGTLVDLNAIKNFQLSRRSIVPQVSFDNSF